MGKKLSYNEVKTFVEENSNCKLLSKEYKGMESKMLFQCGCDKEVFETTFNKFKYRNKRQCNKCSNREIIKWDYNKVVDWLEKNTNFLLVSKEYKNTYSKLKFWCKNCKKYFYTNFRQVLYFNSKNCPVCSRVESRDYCRLTIEYVKNYIESNSDCELLSTNYINNQTKLELKCGCGRKFFIRFGDFDSHKKRQCNICTGNKSYGEIFLFNFLEENDIQFKTEATFKDLPYLRFDFLIFKKDNSKLIIEIDGIQHREYIEYFHKTYENFEKRLKNDQIKNQYCIDNNIHIIRIKYGKKEDIENWVRENKGLILNE